MRACDGKHVQRSILRGGTHYIPVTGKDSPCDFNQITTLYYTCTYTDNHFIDVNIFKQFHVNEFNLLIYHYIKGDFHRKTE